MSTNFMVQFDCDNSAFDGHRDWEIVRLLEEVSLEVSLKILNEGIELNESRPIIDVNGNKIGNRTLREVSDLPF